MTDEPRPCEACMKREENGKECATPCVWIEAMVHENGPRDYLRRVLLEGRKEPRRVREDPTSAPVLARMVERHPTWQDRYEDVNRMVREIKSEYGHKLIGNIRDRTLRAVALMIKDDFTVAEIAVVLGKCERTVRRMRGKGEGEGDGTDM